MTTQLTRRQMLFTAAAPLSAGVIAAPSKRSPSLVELAPLLASAEAESNDGCGYVRRFGAIQWKENVVMLYARCEVNLAEQLLEMVGRITESPLACSWARTGGAWCLFVNGDLPAVRERLAAIVPPGWRQSTDRVASVCWGDPKGGVA